MKKPISIISCYFFFGILSYAGICNRSNITDSLEDRLRTLKGKEKIEILNELADAYISISKEKAIEYATVALNSAKELSRSSDKFVTQRGMKEIANSLNNIGFIYESTDDFAQALEYYEKALAVRKKIGIESQDANNIKAIITSLNNIGIVYDRLGLYDKSLEYYQYSLQKSEEIDDKSGMANSLNNIGIIYLYWNHTEEALECYQRSVRINEELAESTDITKSLSGKNGVAVSLNNIGNVYKNSGNYEKALEYYNKSLKIKKELAETQYYCDTISGRTGIANSLNNIGNVYNEWGNSATSKEVKEEMYRKAMEYYRQSRVIFEETGNKAGMAFALFNIGAIYEVWGNIDKEATKEMYQKALECFEKSEKLAYETNLKEVIFNIYRSFSNIYSNIGNHQKALEYYKQYAEIKDTIYGIESSRKIAEIQVKYEIEKNKKELLLKNKEIGLLQREKKINAFKGYILAGSLFFFLITGILIYSRQRTQRALIKAELNNIQLKNKQLKEKLDFKNKELTNFALHIVQKNEFLENLINEVKEIRDSDVNMNKINKLASLINFHLNIDKDRKDFQMHVEQVNQSFFYNLQKQFPDLTENDRRLSALLMLKLSSKEIATILNISVGSVEIRRHRLRKKMNLDSDQSLTDFMNTV
ncbi:MAG: tetratricopeptide repeat protein [Bacteroidetes bacterium]|nr:tetratricopeptide repeat protein [Bacteroidota bacterium]